MSAPEMRGRRLARYEAIAEIASGGMGVVLLARTAGAGGFQRLFAVKVMHPHLVEDAQFVSMLLDEARVAARIHHPNVVPTVDISQHANLHFLVMDYVEGFQLAEILSHPGFSPPDRLRLVNRILLDAMSGLEASHNLQSDDGSTLGIVHRDVSPQNILVGVDGVGRLTDFGIAFALSRITASRPGIIKGKPAYMAPEQALGNHVDRRADIWALGVMLWEAMTGQRLFVADTDVGTILKVLNDPIPTPRAIVPSLPAELEAVCMRALARDPGKRYGSAREMAAELGRAASYRHLLVDAHAMPEWINRAFGPAIAARRAEIRQHIAALGSDVLPMSSNDVYNLPRLSDSLARARPSPISPPQASASAVAAVIAPGKSTAESVAKVALRSSASPAPATRSGNETPLSSSRKTPERKPMQRSALLAFGMLAACGGVALFVALPHGASPDQSSPGPASAPPPLPPAHPAPTALSPADAPAVTPVTTRAVESGVVPSSSSSGTPLTVAPPGASAAPRPPTQAAAPAAPPHGLVGASPAARPEEPPKKIAPGPAPAGHAVTLEENPYSLR